MLLFIIVFTAVSVLEWIRYKQKKREKTVLLLLLIGTLLWNTMAYCFSWWPSPNDLIMLTFGWVDSLIKA